MDYEKEYNRVCNEYIPRVQELEEENKKLKEYNWELIENHKKDIAILCEENKKLREELEWYKTEYERLVDKLVIKWATELLDEKFPKINWFMEEDTLQELRDLGKI